MQNIVWSAKNNAFFYELDLVYYERAGWDISDVVPISEQIFKTFTNPPAQKIRVVGPDGLPAWEDVPPPTPEELQQQAESQKRQLMRLVREKIDIYQDAVDFGMATEDEKRLLGEWREYRIVLYRVDCATAPDIQWPEQPK
ncbi:tail fiber assembly protein [Xenorhabdus sp. SF857]|uniref:tail fiber assembly protein n=1 Tax=Xenorhabdus bakwenae TaxID=3026967 RepID=UPI002557DDE5|nr:tail fiber assembly protein [Xenorhabdus sp. SF857]WFQ79431.1 tail fiber assembly protein [Xenorhabdus sp. SF857]